MYELEPVGIPGLGHRGTPMPSGQPHDMVQSGVCQQVNIALFDTLLLRVLILDDGVENALGKMDFLPLSPVSMWLSESGNSADSGPNSSSALELS